MSEGFFSRGFRGRRRQTESDVSLPPGQYLVEGFPVLSAGPTPRTPVEEWDFSIVGEVDQPTRWTWEEFRQLPSEEITTDIHCVTKWSKLGTKWEGVSVWLARLLTHPVKGLDNYEEMIRLLTEEKSAIKVFIER